MYDKGITEGFDAPRDFGGVCEYDHDMNEHG